MPEGHDTTIEVSKIMFFVLYTQILKQSVLKPASPGITLNRASYLYTVYFKVIAARGQNEVDSAPEYKDGGDVQ